MKVTIIYPQSDAARAELARRVAVIHAKQITQNIQHLCCSTEQKQHLLDATIRRIKGNEHQV